MQTYKRELLEANPAEELSTAPAQMISDNSALVTVAEGQQGHFPARGDPQDIYTAETDHGPLCSTDEDGSTGLDSDERG
eukprot:649040-Pyramimonas_sp.AAC.1